MRCWSKPKQYTDLWKIEYSSHAYYLCEADYARFNMPLIKSIRISQLPLFKYPEIYNNFPEPFKTTCEVSDFKFALEQYYHKKYPFDRCNYNNCKFCDFNSYINQRKKYFTSVPKVSSYKKY